MALPFDGAVAGADYSVAGRRIEINGLPFVGVTDQTGGGFTVEGMNYQRGADGRILSLSGGIKTPQDVTLKMTVGSWVLLRDTLNAAALLLGETGDAAYCAVIFSIVTQFIAGNPLQPSYSETMRVRVAGRVPEMPNTGENSVMTITLKQVDMPKEN